MKRELRSTGAFFSSHFKDKVRNRKFVVWLVIMPILLISFLNLIGGGVGGEDEGQLRVNVAVVDRDKSTISSAAVSLLENDERLNVKQVEELEEGVSLIRKGDVDAMLDIPEGFSEDWERINNQNETNETLELKVYHAEGGQEDLIKMVLNGITAEINEIVEGDKIKKKIELESRPIDVRDWEYTDLLFPGGVMIVLLQIGFFNSSNTSSSVTENMNYKRLKISPISKIFHINGMVMADALFTFTATIIASITGIILYDVAISLISFLGLILVIFISSLIFSYIGCSIGWMSSKQGSAQGFSSMFVFPLIFFTYSLLFSNLFPRSVIRVSEKLPIYPAINLLESLIFDSPTLLQYLTQIGYLSLWLPVAIGMYLLVIKYH